MSELGPLDFADAGALREATEHDKKSARAVKKIAQSMKKLGLIGVSYRQVQAFQEIGVNLEPQAFIDGGRAGAVIGQQVAVKVLVDLGRIFEQASDKGKQRLVPHMSCMIRALAAANKNVKELALAKQAEQPKKPSQHLHYHTMVPPNAVALDVNGPPNPDQAASEG